MTSSTTGLVIFDSNAAAAAAAQHHRSTNTTSYRRRQKRIRQGEIPTTTAADNDNKSNVVGRTIQETIIGGVRQQQQNHCPSNVTQMLTPFRVVVLIVVLFLVVDDKMTILSFMTIRPVRAFSSSQQRTTAGSRYHQGSIRRCCNVDSNVGCYSRRSLLSRTLLFHRRNRIDHEEQKRLLTTSSSPLRVNRVFPSNEISSRLMLSSSTPSLLSSLSFHDNSRRRRRHRTGVSTTTNLFASTHNIDSNNDDSVSETSSSNNDSSSDPIIIPEISSIEDEYGEDGFYFDDYDFPDDRPPLEEENNFMEGPPLQSVVNGGGSYQDNDNDNNNNDPRQNDDLIRSEQQQQRQQQHIQTEYRKRTQQSFRHHEQERQQYDTMMKMNEERRIHNLQLKRDHLLNGLNPSQIEAVTQPIPPLQQQEHDEELTVSGGIVGPIGTAGTTGTTGEAVITRVIAGPGSGKTRVLTSRIIHLLEQDPYQHRRILAVTFTRKAAGEMRDRVEQMLYELHDLVQEEDDDDEDDDENEDDNDDDGVVRLDRFGDVIVKEEAYGTTSSGTNDGNNEMVKPPPPGLERVELGTFHSVCAKIMRYNGDLLMSLPSVHRDMSQASPVELSPVATSSDGNNNSGGDQPILVAAEANLNGNFAIADQAEQLRIIKECLKEQDMDLKSLDVKPIDIISGISTIRDKFSRNIDPFEKNPKKPLGRKQRLAQEFYYPYREKLLSNNAVDFDDLIFMTRELLMENPDLRQRLHRRWPHVLVDEFQDTSRTQMDLVKLLTSSSLFVVGDADQSIYSWRGAHVRSLHDVKPEFEPYGKVETVYLKENYRSTSNIVKAAEKVISAGNFKRKPTRIDSDSDDEDDDTDDLMKTAELTSDDVRRAMKPKRGAGPSPRIIACADERAEANFVVDTILNMTSKGELNDDSTVAIIYRTNAQSRYLEEACVDNNVPYIIRGGAGGFYKRQEIKDSLCFLKWLYNGDDEASMIRAFKTPSKGIGEKAISEFRAYCGKVHEYYRLSRPNHRRPTPLDILISISPDVVDDGRGIGLVESSPNAEDFISKRFLSKFHAFATKMGDIRAKAMTMTVDKLLFYVIEELQLIDHFDSISKTKAEFADRKENVQELRQASEKYATYGAAMKPVTSSVNSADDNFMDNDSALGIFLDDVALVSDATDAANEEKEGENAKQRMVVSLMTIHASKGTEYDAVFVVGVEEGTLPCSPALKDGESQQLEEERRLCYVAMTRAKTNLVLTWRKEVTSFTSWTDSGAKTTTKSRSRFLDALVSKKKPVSSKKGVRKKKASSMDTDSLLRNERQVVKNGTRQRGTRRQPQSMAREFSSQSKRVVSKKKVSPDSLRRSPKRRNVNSTPKTAYTPSLDRIEALQTKLAQTTNVSSNPISSSFPSGTRSNGRSTTNGESSRRKKQPKKESLATQGIDQAWFFPVGQNVIHRQFGKGVVIGHSSYDAGVDVQVKVSFSNGKTMEFPAMGADILPAM